MSELGPLGTDVFYCVLFYGKDRDGDVSCLHKVFHIARVGNPETYFASQRSLYSSTGGVVEVFESEQAFNEAKESYRK